MGGVPKFEAPSYGIKWFALNASCISSALPTGLDIVGYLTSQPISNRHVRCKLENLQGFRISKFLIVFLSFPLSIGANYRLLV